MSTTPTAYDEREITAAVDLCGADGTLNRAAIGWSRRPLHECNLPASLARKKKWNYWAITSEDLLFSATIADVHRAQTAGAYLFDRRSHRLIAPAGSPTSRSLGIGRLRACPDGHPRQRSHPAG